MEYLRIAELWNANGCLANPRSLPTHCNLKSNSLSQATASNPVHLFEDPLVVVQGDGVRGVTVVRRARQFIALDKRAFVVEVNGLKIAGKIV